MRVVSLLMDNCPDSIAASRAAREIAGGVREVSPQHGREDDHGQSNARHAGSQAAGRPRRHGIAFWDNRATARLGPQDLGHLDVERVLYRVTLVGDVPVGVDGVKSERIEGEVFGAWPPERLRAAYAKASHQQEAQV